MDDQDKRDEADEFMPFGGAQFKLKHLEIETADPDPFGATSKIEVNSYVETPLSWKQRVLRWLGRF
jgi:hypothetical protein